MSQAALAPERPAAVSARDVAFALAVVLPLAAIIAPYRPIHLPQVFILGIAFVGGLWCVKTAVEDVERLFFVFLLYIPFQKVLPGDFGGAARAVNFTNAFLVLFVFGWLSRVAAVEKGYTPRRKGAIGALLVLFLVMTSVSIAAEALRRGEAFGYSLFADLKRWLVPFVIYFFVTAMVSSKRTIKRMYVAVLVTTAVIGLLGVKQFWLDMGGGSRQNLEGVRIAVTSGPSNLGALFAYYLPYLVALLLVHIRNLAWWPLLLPIGWCLDSLRTTFSRGALVAFLGAASAVVFKRSKLAFVALAALAVVALHGRELSLPYSIFGRMTATYNADRPGESFKDKLDTSSQKRLTIWEGGLDMMLEHPFLGVGYGRFPERIGDYRPSVANMDPHNNFLKIGAEMGLPALACFLVVLGACLVKGWRLSNSSGDPLTRALLLGYVGSVVGLFLANLFGSRLESAEISTQFWALTGGVVVLDRFRREEAARAAGVSDSGQDEEEGPGIERCGDGDGLEENSQGPAGGYNTAAVGRMPGATSHRETFGPAYLRGEAPPAHGAGGGRP